MMKLSSGDVDASNIVRPTVDQLSAEDRQTYEAFIKECKEENTRRKEKEIEEKRQQFLSHFSRNRKGEFFKDKEVVTLSDEEEQAKANNNVSTSASPVTMEQISQLLVNGQEKVLATVQNMIDKSLGKQPLANDSSTPMSSVAGTFQNHAMPPESQATPAPQYGMPMNFYDGQKPTEQYNANGAVRLVSQTSPTGHGGLVPTGQTRIPTGQTGPGALVVYQSSPEPIASIPPAKADFSRTNRFTGYCVPPYAIMTYNPYTMPPQNSSYSYGAKPNNGYLQQTPYTQPNHSPQMPNNSSTNVQMANDSYFNQILEKHKKDLAIMFKKSFGIELKDKTLVCQKPYPESFDSIPYPQNFKVP